MDHILSHITHLNGFKRIKIIRFLLSDHNKIKLGTNNRKITGKSPDTFLNETFKEKVSRKARTYFERKIQQTKKYGMQLKQNGRGKFTALDVILKKKM